ncbi:hypothetical protein L596_027123 [Steinernema carpocapsae]|uniref:Uncharacterized protein n=1 Tax=Steinernema carpocapsae TaxID=34508 RepID=A0A4V5ZYE8_STECR|nr:hypothetical protein L596_027123 [Steinernema carpocapsae]
MEKGDGQDGSGEEKIDNEEDKADDNVPENYLEEREEVDSQEQMNETTQEDSDKNDKSQKATVRKDEKPIVGGQESG